MIEEIKKDLDAGMFNKICSNETTFLEYIKEKLTVFEKQIVDKMTADWYGDIHNKKVKEEFLRRIIETMTSEPMSGSQMLEEVKKLCEKI